ncbi:amino acid ABC transporter substrate-binding protein [Halorarum halobium]|uniref:amino acid ABC transporter substrate-binding protein n=1 Tax=Halorarum halobium TaxID=3075121 RepID=UPI0028ADBA50|nr:amino acid ABC transporter substrate-binding protein [Halobaculum sp. XH14]
MDRFDTMGSRRKYLKTAGAVGAAGLSGLAGCTALGGSGGSGTITIAAAVPETGRLSSVGNEMLEGYRLGVDLLNEDGGIDGSEVELIVEDDESDARRLREVLQQITSNNDVDVIWGSFSSPLVMAGSAFAENQGLPFLAVATCFEEPLVSGEKEWTYTPFPKTRDVTRATGEILGMLPEDERPQRVGIWEENSGWGAEMADAWESTLSGAGYDVAMRETYNTGNGDFSTLIAQAESANVEALLANPQPPDGITAMKQLNSSGYMPSFIEFVRAADPQAWWSALGEAGAGVLMSPGWAPGMTDNGNEALLSAYQERFAESEDEIPRVMVGVGYNLAQTTGQALGAAGSSEPDAVRSALDEEEFNTVIGEFSFDQYGMPEEGQLAAASAQWQGGEQRLVFPQTDQASEMRYPIER